MTAANEKDRLASLLRDFTILLEYVMKEQGITPETI
jgi:hypothetical protein